MDPNGSSHSSWGPAVLTGEETYKRKGQAHGVKDQQDRQPKQPLAIHAASLQKGEGHLGLSRVSSNLFF